MGTPVQSGICFSEDALPLNVSFQGEFNVACMTSQARGARGMQAVDFNSDMGEGFIRGVAFDQRHFRFRPFISPAGLHTHADWFCGLVTVA